MALLSPARLRTPWYLVPAEVSRQRTLILLSFCPVSQWDALNSRGTVHLCECPSLTPLSSMWHLDLSTPAGNQCLPVLLIQLLHTYHLVPLPLLPVKLYLSDRVTFDPVQIASPCEGWRLFRVCRNNVFISAPWAFSSPLLHGRLRS
ncbi:hypothetical protein BDN67DRAFT_972975, partial [Paxillus ammoniavirescens]